LRAVKISHQTAQLVEPLLELVAKLRASTPDSQPAPAAEARPAGRAGTRSTARTPSFAVSRTSVVIPAVTADRLTSHTSATGQSVEEMVVLALLDRYETLASR